jgi:hypothetical protein
MNLTQAASFAQLTVREKEVPKKVWTAEQIAEYVFAQAELKHEPFYKMVPSDWQHRWLPSKKFVLVNMPITCAAAPCSPRDEEWVATRIHAKADHPIVVDLNKNNVGKKSVGFVPPVIVLDGKHRFKAAALRGESHILAWVGEEAMTVIEDQLEKMKVKPGKAIGIAASTPFEHRTKLSVSSKSVAAGGPGSGRHPEAGTFEHAGYRAGMQHWIGGNGTHVSLGVTNSERGVGNEVKENGMTKHIGTGASAKDFLRSKYEITSVKK